MNGDELKELKRGLEEQFRPLDGKIDELRKELGVTGRGVDVVRATQKAHGREIKDIKERVTRISDKVDKMPQHWKTELREHVHDLHQDDPSGLIDLAAERAAAAATTRGSGVKIRVPVWLWPLITGLLIGAAAIGALLNGVNPFGGGN